MMPILANTWVFFAGRGLHSQNTPSASFTDDFSFRILHALPAPPHAGGKVASLVYMPWPAILFPWISV